MIESTTRTNLNKRRNNTRKQSHQLPLRDVLVLTRRTKPTSFAGTIAHMNWLFPKHKTVLAAKTDGVALRTHFAQGVRVFDEIQMGAQFFYLGQNRFGKFVIQSCRAVLGAI